VTKVIFQIGLLAFCVATVYFGMQESDLLAVVARAFIVFIAVVCSMMVMLLITASFSSHRPKEGQEEADAMGDSKAAASAAK
jgi:hypothetical protein